MARVAESLVPLRPCQRAAKHFSAPHLAKEPLTRGISELALQLFIVFTWRYMEGNQNGLTHYTGGGVKPGLISVI